jgi:NDP-sugar pyrophosphorylase family protein
MGTTGSLPQTVLVAGGLGTRLRGVTTGIPKVLVPVQGRPLLDWVLWLLAAQGVGSVHMCLGHRADQVLAHLASAGPTPLPVTVSTEVTPAGTAGCLRLAEPYLDDEFVLLLGDTYTPVDLERLVSTWRATATPAAMVVLRNRDWLVPSNVEVRDRKVVRYDKAVEPGELDYVDFGIALLRKNVLSRIPPTGAPDLRVLFDSLIADRQLAAIEVTERFYEVGSPAGLAELNRLVGEGRIRLPLGLLGTGTAHTGTGHADAR